MAELRESGGAMLIQLEGGGEFIVQDARAFRRMLQLLDALDMEETARECRESWERMESGAETGVPARQFLEELRRRIRQAG